MCVRLARPRLPEGTRRPERLDGVLFTLREETVALRYIVNQDGVFLHAADMESTLNGLTTTMTNKSEDSLTAIKAVAEALREVRLAALEEANSRAQRTYAWPWSEA